MIESYILLLKTKRLACLIIFLSFWGCSKSSSSKSSSDAATDDQGQLDSTSSVIKGNTAGSLILGSGTRVDIPDNHGLKVGDEISLEEVAVPQGAVSDGVQSKGNSVHFGVKQDGKSLSSLPSPVSLSISIQNSQFQLAAQLALVACPTKATEDLCVFFNDDAGKTKNVYTKNEYSLSCTTDKVEIKFLTSKTGYFTPASCKDNKGVSISTKANYTSIPSPSLSLISGPDSAWISSETSASVTDTSISAKCTVDGYIKILDSNSTTLIKTLVSSNKASTIKISGASLKSLGEGSHTLKLVCVNTVDKSSTENISIKVGIDNSSPATASNLSISLADPVTSSSTNVNLRVSNGVSVTDNTAVSPSVTYDSRLFLSWTNSTGDTFSGLKTNTLEIFRDGTCATKAIHSVAISDGTTSLTYDDSTNFQDGVSYSFKITSTDTIGLSSSICSTATTLDLSAPYVINVTSPNSNLYTPAAGGDSRPWQGSYSQQDPNDNTIIITVQFNKPVFVSALSSASTSPSIMGPILYLKATDPNASVTPFSISYLSGTGTDTLSFVYDIGKSQLNETTDAVSYVGTNSLYANDTQITDKQGIPAKLVLPAPGTAGSLDFNTHIQVQTPL